MLWRCVSAHMIVSGMLTLSFARDLCTYNCDTCGTGVYYDIDQSQIQSSSKGCHRNGKDFDHVLLSKLACERDSTGLSLVFRSIWKDSELIHESSTCDIRNFLHVNDGSNKSVVPQFLEITTTWDDSETGSGCRIEARLSETWLWWLQVPPMGTIVCLHRFRWRQTFLVLSIAALVGFFLSLFSDKGRCRRKTNPCQESFSEKALEKGALLIAARARVQNENRKSFYTCLAYRCVQVVSNTGTPAFMLIIFSPFIWIPLYVVLYVAPVFWYAGRQVCRYPYLLVSPPDLSLFGIDHVQEDFTLTYLYHGFRWIPMCCGCGCVAYFMHEWFPEADGAYSVNTGAFYRMGLMSCYSELVFVGIFAATCLANVVFCIMTCVLVTKHYTDNRCFHKMPIGFSRKRKLGEEVEVLAKRIVEQAVKIKSDVAEEEAIFRKETSAIVQSLLRQETQSFSDKVFDKLEEDFPDHHLGRLRFTFLSLLIECLASLATLAGYFFKIYIFASSGQKCLVFVVMALLSLSISRILLDGTLRRAREAITTSAKVGVKIDDYLHLASWNDSGILTFMVTIYGVPISDLQSWPSAFLALFFSAKSAHALALVLVRTIDFDADDDVFAISGQKHGVQRMFAALRADDCCEAAFANESGNEISDMDHPHFVDIAGNKFVKGDLVTCTAPGDFNGERMAVKDVSSHYIHFEKANSSDVFIWECDELAYYSREIEEFGIKIRAVRLGDRVESLLNEKNADEASHKREELFYNKWHAFGKLVECSLQTGDLGMVVDLADQNESFEIKFDSGISRRLKRWHFRILLGADDDDDHHAVTIDDDFDLSRSS